VKFPLFLRLIVAGSGLLMVGCDRPTGEPQHADESPAQTVKSGPEAPSAPIEPSPVPSLPDPSRVGMDSNGGAMIDGKKAETGPDPKKEEVKSGRKAEPKPEMPR